MTDCIRADEIQKTGGSRKVDFHHFECTPNAGDVRFASASSDRVAGDAVRKMFGSMDVGPINSADKPPTDKQIEDAFGKYAKDGVRLNHNGLDSQYNWFRPNAVKTDSFGRIDQPDYVPHNLSSDEQQISKLKHVALPEGEVKGSVYVDQAHFATAPLDVGLHTADLETCAALIVVDQSKGQQYLAHIDTSVTPDQIRQSLKDFNLNDPNTKIYMLPGEASSTAPAAIMEAFSGTPAAQKIEVVDWTGEPGRHGIAVYDGKIMKGSNRLGQDF